MHEIVSFFYSMQSDNYIFARIAEKPHRLDQSSVTGSYKQKKSRMLSHIVVRSVGILGSLENMLRLSKIFHSQIMMFEALDNFTVHMVHSICDFMSNPFTWYVCQLDDGAHTRKLKRKSNIKR